MNPVYLETARLLIQVAPLVFADDTFALKGGTAINLFVRDMPRLSVDLDLVFPDHTLPRDAALARINEAVRQAAERLKKRGFQTHTPAAPAGETKLLVRRGSVQVKIEVNFVMRGTVRPVRRAALTPAARDMLMADLEIPVVSLEDVYGGKLVAALDRQHPRDLFDVMQLFAHEGITPGIRRAFVVYLASSNRPVHEVLFPPLRDIRHDFAHSFQVYDGRAGAARRTAHGPGAPGARDPAGAGRRRAALPAIAGRRRTRVRAARHRASGTSPGRAMEAPQPGAAAKDKPEEVCRTGRDADHSAGRCGFERECPAVFKQGMSMDACLVRLRLAEARRRLHVGEASAVVAAVATMPS